MHTIHWEESQSFDIYVFIESSNNSASEFYNLHLNNHKAEARRRIEKLPVHSGKQ